MKVFISWSGEPSRQVAHALHDWLPVAIQAVEPYMSEQDNQAGVRWLEKLLAELQTTNFGVICLASNNLDSRWLNFEAGALSKAVDASRVVPLLYGYDSPTDLPPPLSQFQAKLANRNGIKDILTSINAQLESPLAPEVLAQSFELTWPNLETALDLVVSGRSPAKPPPRSERELIEEVLQLLRQGVTVKEPATGEAEYQEMLANDMMEVAAPHSMRMEFVGGLVRLSGVKESDLSPRQVGHLRDAAAVFGKQITFSPGWGIEEEYRGH